MKILVLANWKLTKMEGASCQYQLEDEVVGDALEEVDALDEGEEEVVRDAGANGLRQGAERLLLLEPLGVGPELEAEVRHHLLLQPRRQLVAHGEGGGGVDGVPVRPVPCTTRLVMLPMR